MKSKWQYKVVKTQRGQQGQWFRHRAAYTSVDEASAVQYAEGFAAEQQAAGVTGTRVLVLARKGDRVVREFGW